jgi:hypothetical protein
MRTLFLLLLATPVALAQHRVEPPNYEQPSHSDIVLAGNEIHQTVTCNHGNAVYVQGQSNEVEVEGNCRFVRVQGNRNHLFVHASSPIHVEGNENFIEVANPDTPFSERGERNRFERRGK